MGAKLKAVSEEINQCIQALHQLPSLQSFALGGGTNLALRYQHRRSYDIDLFTNEVVGKKGFQQIFQELQSHLGYLKNDGNYHVKSMIDYYLGGLISPKRQD